jgi:hypothetical protein
MHLSLHRRRFSVLRFLFRSWHFFGHMLSQATSEDDTEEGAEAADKVADDPSGPSEGENGW